MLQMLRVGICLLLFGLWVEPNVRAQNLAYAREVVRALTSPELAGRGYVKDGDANAAAIIKNEFIRNKLIPLANNYYQSFNFPVIYFPEEIDIIADGADLVPGYEALVNPGCPRTNGTFKVLYIDSATLDNNQLFKKLQKKSLHHTFIVADGVHQWQLVHPERKQFILNNLIKAKGLVYLQTEHLMWGVATQWAEFPVIYIKKNRLKHYLIELKLNINPQFKYHNTQNVIGYVKGNQFPDSFVVFTAHYDHLGMLGESALFAGANDNASGVAMMLDLAQHYTQNPPPYSVVFIAFAGEEAGLIGSHYYTTYPEIPLKKISLLLNLDLMATGDKGITMVNATLYPDLFKKLQIINTINNLLPAVNERGKAQNSDHYYFSEAGVKAFFFYLMGEYHAYHDVNDNFEAVTFSKYNEAFKLIQLFANDYMNPNAH